MPLFVFEEEAMVVIDDAILRGGIVGRTENPETTWTATIATIKMTNLAMTVKNKETICAQEKAYKNTSSLVTF